MLQKRWLNFVMSVLNSRYWMKLLARYVPAPCNHVIFLSYWSKNVHHFVSCVCKAENYLPKFLRFMLLITSYLLHYSSNLRINMNSLIYGKNVKCLTKAGYHFLDFHLMLLILSIFSIIFLDRISWFFQTYNIIHLFNNLYCWTADVKFATSFLVLNTAMRFFTTVVISFFNHLLQSSLYMWLSPNPLITKSLFCEGQLPWLI